MRGFAFDAPAAQAQVRAAERDAERADLSGVLDAARSGGGLDAADVARLWFAPMSTETLYTVARAAHAARAGVLETFSPLYLTNTCDAECRMCGMRRNNTALQRETADSAAIDLQLQLLERRGMHAVALLTGEYAGAQRTWAMAYVNRALRAACALGFVHILVNVGSIDAEEYEALLAGMARRSDGRLASNLTMSTFQETYSPAVYAKFMGTSADNPRADFSRRLTNCDRAATAGFTAANPGILLGLNPDVAYEATAFVQHARHLADRGLTVYLSVPRLRRIAGSGGPRAIGNAEFVRLVAILSLALPTARIVITTREDSAMQRHLAPVVSVISAGSAAVAPYTDDGARFPLQTSQFEVIDQRPFEAVLDDHRRGGAQIVNFDPPVSAA